MNTLSTITLKILHKLYAKAFKVKPLPKPVCEKDSDIASQLIYNKLIKDEPCMIARFGSTELITLLNYLGVKDNNRNLFKYIKGETLQWWWNKNNLNQMQQWSGFFPPTPLMVERFSKLMLEDMEYVDILGSWIPEEVYFEKKIKSTKKVQLLLLEPYIAIQPWSRYLEGKKVLVIHPFAALIEEQYKKKEFLFKNQEVLPDFSLETITAVQSLGGENNGFKNWFEALQWMKNETDKKDYDVCLIGCGAYGFPLAAHVKRKGKKAIHLGGALQLMFGIKGKRWENPDYATGWGLPSDTYLSMFNDYWVKPTSNFKPTTAEKVEAACYW